MGKARKDRFFKHASQTSVDKNQRGEHESAKMKTAALWIALIAGFITACTVAQTNTRSKPKLYSFSVKATFPHDPNAFTQGLEYEYTCDDSENCTDMLWESTGMNGQSEVRHVELTSGKVLKRKKLDARDFGEGIVKIDDKLLQLTWRSSKALLYSANNLEDVKEVHTPLKDGWGITHTGGSSTDLIISDGTATLTQVDRNTLETKAVVQVTDEGKPVRMLNELEWIKGEVWANVWQTECVARINHKTGEIRGWVLLHGLMHKLQMKNVPQTHPMDVLNGIAWDKKNKRFFVTGKYWPSLFELQLRPHPRRHNPQTLDVARQRCIL